MTIILLRRRIRAIRLEAGFAGGNTGEAARWSLPTGFDHGRTSPSQGLLEDIGSNQDLSQIDCLTVFDIHFDPATA